jgi:hypothetical protein
MFGKFKKIYNGKNSAQMGDELTTQVRRNAETPERLSLHQPLKPPDFPFKIF